MEVLYGAKMYKKYNFFYKIKILKGNANIEDLVSDVRNI